MNWGISKLMWEISQILTRALESLKNVYFNALLLSKAYIVWAKNVIWKSCLSWHWRGKKLERNLFKIEKRNLRNFDLSTQKSQNFSLLWSPFELKKVQRSYRPWHWRMMQNLKKTDLKFRKWLDELEKFSPEHSKVSKLGLWCDLSVLFEF